MSALYLRGKLLPEERDEIKELALAYKEHVELLDKRRNAKEAALARKTQPPRVVTLRRKSLFIDLAQGDNCRADLLQSIDALRIAVSDSRMEADLYLCQTPSEPSRRTMWACMLNGGTIVDKEFVASEGRAGISLCYSAAVTVPRKVWISPNWANAHSELAQIVRAAISMTQSRWTRLSSKARFFTELQKVMDRPREQRRPMDVVALVTPVEKASEDHSQK